MGSRANFAKQAANLWSVKQQLQQALANELGAFSASINLQTAVRANMKEIRSEGFVKWLVSTRRLVETAIGQLADRITRKVLAHTVCFFINKQLGNPPLQFELLRV